MATKLSQGKRGTAAQIDRQIQPATDGQITTTATQHLAHHQLLAGGHGDSTVHRHRFTIQGSVYLATAQSDHAIGMKTQTGALNRALQSRSRFAIADQAVRQTKRSVIHRSRRGNADIPITDAAGVILHSGI